MFSLQTIWLTDCNYSVPYKLEFLNFDVIMALGEIAPVRTGNSPRWFPVTLLGNSGKLEEIEASGFRHNIDNT